MKLPHSISLGGELYWEEGSERWEPLMRKMRAQGRPTAHLDYMYMHTTVAADGKITRAYKHYATRQYIYL